MMGIDEKPGVQGKEIIPVERHGVKVISMAFSLKKMHQLLAWSYVRKNVDEFLC